MGVVVFSGHHEKVSQAGVLNNRNSLLHVLEAGSPRSRYRQGWSLLGLSLACRRHLPSPATVSPRGHPSVRVCVLVSSYKDNRQTGSGLT